MDEDWFLSEDILRLWILYNANHIIAVLDFLQEFDELFPAYACFF